MVDLSKIEPTIIAAMARALFVSAWADEQEQRAAEGKKAKIASMGQDWMNVAPKTPRYAMDAAHNLCGRMEELNRMGLISLFFAAIKADGKMLKLPPDGDGMDYDQLPEDAETLAKDFGHCLAMQALGHGVSWFDDHEKFDLKFPFVFQFELQGR